MGYTIKQKIDICLKAESNPEMTQSDLAQWAKEKYGSDKPPSQTTISRILSSKNELVASKDADFKLVRRRRQQNPLLRKILAEWITQAIWENIPITTPIIQLTASAIWNRLPMEQKDGNGIFTQKWCSHFVKRLNVCLTGSEEDIARNPGNNKLNRIWKLDEKVELKEYIANLIRLENYSPQDIFTIDEFQLFYQLPLDQIFDISSVDKGLKQLSSSPENSLTIMLGCNADGSEKLTPLVVGKYERFDLSQSSHTSLKNIPVHSINHQVLMNRLTEVYQLFYKSNSNKWITLSMFQNYLLTLDHKLGNQSPPRKILIILDDSSSHRIINLKFNHIRLCYLKNNISQKNPYNTLYSGVKFDYLPMSFGIVEEFKILYRLQQYLEMINLQRIQTKKKRGETNPGSPEAQMTTTDRRESLSKPETMEILSEENYRIPLVKVIEWIKRSWDSITQEKIYASWKKTHLISFTLPWPSSDSQIAANANHTMATMLNRSQSYNHAKSYDKLLEIMGYLNAVIPFEIDDLLGLVNEKAKVTLSYLSIEEIIGSCLLEEEEDPDDQKDDTFSIPPGGLSSSSRRFSNNQILSSHSPSGPDGTDTGDNTLGSNLLAPESWFNLSTVPNALDAPTPTLLNNDSPLTLNQTPLPSLIQGSGTGTGTTPQLTNAALASATNLFIKRENGLPPSPLPLLNATSSPAPSETGKSGGVSNSMQFEVGNYGDFSNQPESANNTPMLTISSLITAGNVLANSGDVTGVTTASASTPGNNISNLPLPNALTKELENQLSPLPPIINTNINKHRLDNSEAWQTDKRKPPMLFSGIPNTSYGTYNYLSGSPGASGSAVQSGVRHTYTDNDVIGALRKLLEISTRSPGALKLSSGTVEELKSKLKEIQLKSAPRQYNQSS